jgi:hypothetical protein
VPGGTVALAGVQVEAYRFARRKRFAQFFSEQLPHVRGQKLVVAAVEHLLFRQRHEGEKGRVGVEDDAFLVLKENQFGAVL